MKYYNENLDILKKINPNLTNLIESTQVPPEYEIVEAKSGSPSLKVDGVYLHSSYDPALEAERQAEKTEITQGAKYLLKGFGLGYLAETLIKKGADIIVAEADPAVLRAAIESRDLTSLLAKTPIFCGQDAREFNNFLEDIGCDSQPVEIKHKPSYKRNPGFYDSLQKIEHYTISSVSAPIPLEEMEAPQGLKILLPSPLYGGSLPIAHYCKDALESLGHKVDFFDSSLYYPPFKSVVEVTSNPEHQAKLRGLYTMFVSELVMAKALEDKPDMVLGIAQSPFTRETLAEFKSMRIPVAFWFMEDFRLFQYWKDFAPIYDYFFTIQRGEFSELLDNAGVKNHYYLPLAADPNLHKPQSLSPEEQREFGSALSFVGAGYYNRHHFFLQLLNEDFKIWGVEWNQNSPLGRILQRGGERISTEDCVKIFNAAKINLNLHSSSYHTGVNPHGDFVNPRVFEIAACGAFQLVDPRSEMSDLFEIGKEIETFKDINDLRSKIKYYLANPAKMKEIAEAGRNRVLREHTYKHRMEQLLKIVAANEPKLRERKSNPNIAANLLKSAGDDEELKDIFGRFNPTEELNIDMIAENIRKGKGELKKSEGVFLLMKEFYDWAREKKVI